ncbi:MAG: DNA gyrase subunit A [Bacilli bacterium]
MEDENKVIDEVVEEEISSEENSLPTEEVFINDGIVAGIKDVEVSGNVKSGFLDYAMSVIVSRALPDVRDGFKPVHRRIIFAMNESGYTPDKPHVKCAKIVGDVMGNYHPHGDTAIYESLVRMAQDFSMRYMLIDGHGNFGNIDGDGAAAYRYTEARLNRFAANMVRDIKENTVNFIDNYDGSEKEPVVLPARFPNLLVNGSNGIAVGMATNIPPHNLNEVCAALRAYALNPDISVTELMENYISGPDFPTGGYILGRTGIKTMYETGKGDVVVRGKATIVDSANGNKKEIIITEIPYQVNKANLVRKIGELADSKIIPEITDVKDETSHRTGIKVIVELSKDAVPEVVLNQIYKQTQLQGKFNAQVIALVDGAPKILTLKDMLKHYLEFQIEVITRRTVYRKDKAIARRHILDGLILATDDIDNVIRIIRSTNTSEEAANALKEKYALSDEQVEAILAMTLRRLTGLEKQKLVDELNEIIKTLAELEHILASRENKLEVIFKELGEVVAKFGDARRTIITDAEEQIEDEDLIEKQDIVITLTKSGYIKRMSLDTFKTQNRGGKGVKGMSTHADDEVFLTVNAHTHTDLLFFSNLGRIYRLRGHRIPEANRIAKGIPISNFLNLAEGEDIRSIITCDSYCEGEYLFFATKLGVVKRTDIREFDSIRQNGKIAITLRENDQLLDVKKTDGSAYVSLVATNGKMVKFLETDVRVMGRSAAGVKGMNVDGSTAISLSTSLEGELVLVITTNGYGKMSTLDGYRLTRRGSKGVYTIKATEKNGQIVDMKVVKGEEDLVVITKGGILIRVNLGQIKICGRNTMGVKIINIKEKEAVSSIAIVPHQEEVVDEVNEGNDILDENYIATEKEE